MYVKRGLRNRKPLPLEELYEARCQKVNKLRAKYKYHDLYPHVEMVMAAIECQSLSCQAPESDACGNTVEKVIKKLKEFFPGDIAFIRKLEDETNNKSS